MPWLQPGDTRWKAFDSVVLKASSRPIAEVPLKHKEIEFTRAGDAFKTTGDQFSARAVLVSTTGKLPFVGCGNVSFICARDAEYSFVAGSDAETPGVPLHDRADLRSTAPIPALPLKPAGGPLDARIEYAWGHVPGNGIHPHEPGTGGRYAIGPVHRLHAEHFVQQAQYK